MSDAKNQKKLRDLLDFQEDIDQMIAQAEAHLGVAHGAIRLRVIGHGGHAFVLYLF